MLAGLVLCVSLVLLPHGGRLMQLALVGMAGLDLVLFGASFHQKAPIDQVAQSTPAIEFLADCKEQGGGCQPANGFAAESNGGLSQWRVFTPGTIPSLEFDRLVPFRIEDVGGYSSLEPKRHFTYWTIMSDIQNGLLDIANVGYVVFPRVKHSLPSYGQVPFDPDKPLLLGSRGAIGGTERYLLDGARAHRIQVVGGLTRAIEIPDDDVVVELAVVGRDGRTAIIPLRAGRDLAEWAYARPDLRGRIKHSRPDVVAFHRAGISPVDGQRFDYELYYSEHDLPEVMDVERVDIRAVHPLGGVEIYGIGLYDFDAGQTTGITEEMRAKLRAVYEDEGVRIFENLEAFPRAYVVPIGRFARDDNALSEMLDAPFDPRREVILEEESSFDARVLWDRDQVRARAEGVDPVREATPRPEPPAGDAPIPAPAHAEVANSDRVVYRASAPQGGYFVHVANLASGWRAWVDGQEAPIFRANSLFRAVPLPPGDHEIELRYEPGAVALGWTISGWATAVAILSLALALIIPQLHRLRHFAQKS
jgi:hypothetical protein